jgi:hypothetical protein
VTFVATNATTVAAQAVPGTIAYLPSGSTPQPNNNSTISAIVRDDNNNLVKNARVNFTVVSDPSGGYLKSPSAVTDASGTASVTYVAGGNSSEQNGVVIRAQVGSSGVTDTATLTVAGQSLQVRLGTDNKIATTADNANQKTYLAIVTDAAGNAVPGVTVYFALRSEDYYIGSFQPNAGNTKWVAVPTDRCKNEDTNYNGNLDAGEDLTPNLDPAYVPNNKLDPGAVASVNASDVTDGAGIAVATLTYAKSYSLWVDVTLSARTGVTSNDPPTEVTFNLPGAAADYAPLTVDPPPIPFVASTCYSY